MPLISVVVPTRNRVDQLRDLLEALDAQTYPHYEVIVIDDASSDGTAEVLAEWQRKGRTAIRLDSPSGSYVARNLGWQYARGEIVAFTDDDCLPASVWLSELAVALRDPGSVAAQGVTLAQPGEITPFTHQIEQRHAGPPYRTCNIAYRRDVLQRLGGFQPMRWYADNILGLRARRAGPIVFMADAIVFHPPRPREWRDRQTWLARFDADAVHRQWLRDLGEEHVNVGNRALPIILWILRPFVKQSLAHARYFVRHPLGYLHTVRPMLWEKRELLAALRQRRDSIGKRATSPLPPLPAEPLVSVVIVTRDRPDSLRLTLAALRAQTYSNHEIVVVDHSSDGTARMVAEEFSIRWVGVPTGTLASARQRGVEATTGEVVAFTDDDCLPNPLWLETLVSAFRREPTIWGMQGRTIGERGPIGSHALSVSRLDPLYQTCNIAYRRAAINAAGGFDERFAGWFEDTALGARVARLGTIGFSREATVIHRAMPRRPFDRNTWARLLTDERVLADEYPDFYRHTRGPGFFPVVMVRWMVGSPLKTVCQELPHSFRDPVGYCKLVLQLVRERAALARAVIDVLIASPSGKSGRSSP